MTEPAQLIGMWLVIVVILTICGGSLAYIFDKVFGEEINKDKKD